MTEALRGGIDLGGTKIQAVVTGPGGEVVGQARFNTPRRGGPDAVADGIAHAIGEAATAAGARVRELAGVGVGAPGSVDPGAGVVVKVPNLDGWDEPFALGPVLTKRLGVPVAVGNDVSVAVDAERRFGAGRDVSSFLGVFWGTGVGGGLVLDGRLVHGRGSAGVDGRPGIGGCRREASGVPAVMAFEQILCRCQRLVRSRRRAVAATTACASQATFTTIQRLRLRRARGCA